MSWMTKQHSIGELSREFDVTTRTIRFYEDEGLLSPNRNGRVRVYSSRDRVRLKLILRGKRLGFTLGEIRGMLDLYDSPQGEVAQLHRVCAKVRERRESLEQQRKDIEVILRELEALEAQCAGALAQTPVA